MGRHVIVGKGPVGTATAQALLQAGHEVRVLSRSGGTSTPDVEHVAVDATDAGAVAAATRGADALYNAVNPEYHRWATDWPPLAAALLLFMTVAWTAFYLVRKQRADTAILEVNGGGE